MKTYLISLMSIVAVTATTTRPPLFKVPILGWTDLDFISGAEGFGEGVFGVDVRGQFDQCLNGIPLMIEEIYKTITDLDLFSNPLAIFKNFDKIKVLVNTIFDLVKEGPEAVKGCTAMWTEGSTAVSWIVKHLNIATVTTNLIANILANLLPLASDVWSLVQDVIGASFYNTGKDSGEIFMVLFN